MSAQASSNRVPPLLPLSSPNTNPPPPAILSPALPSTASTKSTLSSPSLSSPSLSSPSISAPSTTTTSPDQQRLISEARTALLASMSNIGSNLDSSLQVRAKEIHANTKVLEAQEKELLKNTKALEGFGGKLEKLAMEGGKRVKELGNVQNWAEVLERDFLVLGEVMRLVEGGGGEGSEGSESSWSSSDGDEEGRTEPIAIVGGGRVDMERDVEMDGVGERGGEDVGGEGKEKGKGKEREVVGQPEGSTSTASMTRRNETVGGSSTATVTSASNSMHTASGSS